MSSTWDGMPGVGQHTQVSQLLAALVETSDDAIISKDLNGIITTWNQGAERLFGYTAEEVIGKAVTILIPPERHDEESRILERICHGQRIGPYETIRRRQDGSLVEISLTVSPIKDAQGNIIGASKIARDITERKRIEEEIERRVSARTRQLTVVNAALRKEITERKLAEEALHEARATLAHVTRVTTMGELIATIAHEVNQPLGAIVTNGQACLRLLARESPSLDKARKVVERMVSEGMRASAVITRMRTLLQKRNAETVLLNVNEIIREVIALASTELCRSAIHLQTALAADVPPVQGDRVQLQQVLLNLMLNAKEAMSGVGWQPRGLCITSLTSTSSEVVVAVRDSGPGLDPRDGDRIFDAFFTTKAEGLGLGLSICRTIIEAHGGRLWATPNEDQGTTIQFALPASGRSK